MAVSPILTPTRRGRGRAGHLLRVLAILVAAVSSGLAYSQLQASTPMRVQDLPLLTLAGKQRLLVVAPHPDDETLGAAGLIQAAVNAAIEVRVVVVTNGDGQWAAPLALHGRVRARAEDYVAVGEIRQAETLAALQYLGLPAEAVSFLGYADGTLDPLWRYDWTSACPLKARFTQSTASPYSFTFDTTAAYCGHDLQRTLLMLLTDYLPDVIILPHPQDDHPDHRATSAFVRLALALAQQTIPAYEPAVWAYLVHHGDFPQPRGWRMGRHLLPPARLALAEHWTRFDLSDEQVQVKAAAVRAYSSQVRLLAGFLPSFVRRNELFDELPITDVPKLEWNAVPELVPLAWHTIPEPARESARRVLHDGTDLVGLQAARVGNQLWLTAMTRGAPLQVLRYQILVKTPDGLTHIYPLPNPAARIGRTSLTVQIDLAELGQPTVLSFAAEIRQGPTLDRTAWHLLALGPISEDVTRMADG